MENSLERTNNHLCFRQMELICFDDLGRFFVCFGLLSSIDHFHTGKFGSVGNRSPKSPLKAHAFLYDKVDQIMGRRELPVGRAHSQADAILAYGDYNWTFCCLFHGNTHDKKYHGSSAITISVVGTNRTCRRDVTMSAVEGGADIEHTRLEVRI